MGVGAKTGRKMNFNEMDVEVVKHSNYLGTLLSNSGNSSTYHEYLVGKSLKALNMLLFNCKLVSLTLRYLCQFYDSFVGVFFINRVSGFSKSNELEH